MKTIRTPPNRLPVEIKRGSVTVRIYTGANEVAGQPGSAPPFK